MLFKIIIITALLHEFSCDNKQKDDLELHHEALIVPDKAGAKDSCAGVLVKPKFLLAYFPCVKKLFETYENVSLKVLAGVKGFPGFSDELKGYEQFTYAVSYVASTYSKTAIVEVEDPFVKTNKVNFANLPKKGEQICRKANATALFVEEKSKLKSRWWFIGRIIRRIIKIIKIIIKVVKVVKKVVKKAKKVVKVVKTAKTWYEKAEEFMKEVREKKRKERREKIREEREKKKKKKEQEKETNINTYIGVAENISSHMCKKHKGWPTFCGRTIWGFQTLCEQSKTRAGGFDLELSDINDDLDLIAKQTGIKVTDSKEKAKGNAFTPRAANEIILLTIVCGLVKLY